MEAFVRPRIEPLVFRDPTGEIIEYGERWAGSPPDDSYEVVQHPERFAPLHTVVTALIDHLAARYDVHLEVGHAATSGLVPVPDPDHIVRVAKLTPRAAGCSPITFILTDFPGVELHAGSLFRAVQPSCGCNACGETWDTAADDLEWQVGAIVAGGLSEAVSAPRRAKWSFTWGRGFTKGMGQTVSYRLRGTDESEQGAVGAAADVPGEVLARAIASLEELASVSPAGNWLPWPVRERACDRSDGSLRAD